MTLKVGQSYRVHFSDGSAYNVTIVSDEGNEWYKVSSTLGEFFFNLRQVVRIHVS
jgi:hypothetical protein